MPQSVVDWLVVLFFLTALILVARFRRSMSAVDAPSYTQITVGLAILSLVALARLYAGLGAFDALPFLSEPLFFKLVSWIAIITGIMFLINGVSSWLPLARKLEAREAASRGAQNLIREIDQLIAVEHRMDPLLTNVLAHMVEALRLKGGAVYTISSTFSESRLVTAAGDIESFQPRLRDAHVDHRGWQRYVDGFSAESSGIITDLPITLGMPSLVLPVVVNERLRAVFVAWSGESTNLTTDDRLQLKLVADILARRMREELTQLKNRFLTQCTTLQDTVQNLMDTSGARPESLTLIARSLADVLPIDYLSLVLMHPTRSLCDRYSVGADHQLLTYRGMPWPGQNERLAQVMLSAGPTTTETHPDLPADLPAGFVPSGLHSVALAPIRAEGQPGGLLILGAERPRAFGRRTAALLAAVLPSLAQLVYSHARRQSDITWESRMSRLVGLSQHADRQTNTTAWLDRVAEFLSGDTGAEAVRISACEPGGRFLISRALRTSNLSPHMAPASESMILSLMPAHQEALADKRTLLLTDSELIARSSEAERQIVCSGDLRQLLIAPVILRGRSIGAVTVADSRSSDLFSIPDNALSMVTAVTWLLSGIEMRESRSQTSRTIDTSSVFDDAIRRSLTRAMRTSARVSERADAEPVRVMETVQ